MGAYRVIKLMLKGYAVGKGERVEGYFKIQNKDMKGIDRDGNQFNIPFRGLTSELHSYFTLIHFTSDLEGNMRSTLDDIINTVDLNTSQGTTEVYGKVEPDPFSQYGQFFTYVLGLLRGAFPKLFTQTLTLKGNKKYNAYREHLIGFPEEFKGQFSKTLEEKDTRRNYGAYAFDKLIFKIEPKDWGQCETESSRKKGNGGGWDYHEPHPDM